MSKPKVLERLLRIREIEEEQRRVRLGAAMAKLASLEKARDAATNMERHGRTLIAASALSGEIADRQAGLIETEAARRRARMLAPRIAASQREIIQCRQDFMHKRVERRQAETLLEHDDAQEKLESGRRSQRSIDDWYGANMYRRKGDNRGHE